MKVLKEGNPKGTRIWKGQCNACTSEMSEIESALTITHEQKDGDFATAECPICEEEFHLYASNEYEDFVRPSQRSEKPDTVVNDR
jgi:hypothetical protein